MLMHKQIRFKRIIKQNFTERPKPMIILLNQLIKKENTDNKWKEKIYLLILEKIKLYNLKLILHQICGLKEEMRLLYIFKEKLEDGLPEKEQII